MSRIVFARHINAYPLVNRGFAKGVSQTMSPCFFSNETETNRRKREETEENGKKPRKTRKRTGGNRRKREKNRSKEDRRKRGKPEATQFGRLLLRNLELRG